EGTHDSIPNLEAMLDCAVGSAMGMVWESISLSDFLTGEWRSSRSPAGCSPPPLPFFRTPGNGTGPYAGRPTVADQMFSASPVRPARPIRRLVKAVTDRRPTRGSAAGGRLVSLGTTA